MSDRMIERSEHARSDRPDQSACERIGRDAPGIDHDRRGQQTAARLAGAGRDRPDKVSNSATSIGWLSSPRTLIGIIDTRHPLNSIEAFAASRHHRSLRL
jgi:hypothetical protein